MSMIAKVDEMVLSGMVEIRLPSAQVSALMDELMSGAVSVHRRPDPDAQYITSSAVSLPPGACMVYRGVPVFAEG